MARTTPKTRSSETLQRPTTGATSGSRTQKTKKQACLELLQRTKGASLAELQNATGWQAHSVRGFLAGTVRRLPETKLVTLTPSGAPRRYRVVGTENEA
jgi:hypothetical protein